MIARRGRSFYVPPHLRQPSSSSFRATTTAALDREFPSDDRHPRSQLPFNPYRSRPGRGRGDGGRRRQPYGRNAYPDYRNHVPFEEPPEEVITEGSKSEGFINFEAYDDVSVEVSGENIPAPANSFEEIDLGDGLHKNISRCRYEKPTPIQRHAIPIVVAGRDLMACAQTGSGKTAAFCLPIICGLLRNGASNDRRPASRVACPTALVLSPTRELSCQIHEEARKFAYQTGIKIGVAYGGAPLMQQVRNLERGVDVLVATPGRLVDMVEKDRVSLRLIKYLAIDEADRMLDMGFEPQIRRIVEQLDMPLAGARQTLLFSATFPNDIQMLASDFLSNYIFLAVGRVGSSTELIAQKVEFVEDMDKKRHLKDLLHARREAVNSGKVISVQELTLVFVETKRRADFLESWLSRNGFPAVAIHGDKVQVERERVLRSFKSGTTPIMVATDVASRGLDIPNVAHVVNFDLPQCIDDYVHRIGRTGRAGKSGLATAFFNSKNFSLAKALADIMKETNQEIPPWLGEYDGQSFDVGNNGMLRNYRSSKFSGRDFRRGSKVEKKNSNTSYSNYSCSTATDHHAPAYADYSNALADQQLGCQLGYESIEPSGWE